MTTGTNNSSTEVKQMGNTPKSDKAGLLPAKEPVKGGLKKNSMPEKEPKSPGGNKMPLAPVNFNKKSRGQ